MRKSALYNIIYAILLLTPAVFTSAENVSRDKAAAAAQAFWSAAQTKSWTTDIQFAWDSRSLQPQTAGLPTKSSAPEPALYHVFSAADGRGFVIVSGEDSVSPILAYSFENPAPTPENLPGGMAFWINWVSDQIRNIRSTGYEDEAAAALWATKTVPGKDVANLGTAKWNQSDPFNRSCPEIEGTRCLTGCVATAVGTVMRYHKWPESGIGTTAAYVCDNGVAVEARNLEHEYVWDNMPDISADVIGYTPEQAAEISTLLADIGAACKLEYGVDWTGGFIYPSILYEHFRYNPGTMYMTRQNISDDIWLGLLKEDLNNELPILYAGEGDSGAHQFILDGYIDNDYFHVNWGWGGYADGYFTLSTLDPNGDISLNENQSAYFGLKPHTSETVDIEHWLMFYETEFTCSTTEFIVDEEFTISNLSFYNFSSANFHGFVCAALCSRDGERKEWISSEIELPEILSMYYDDYNEEITCKITQALEPGDRIRFFYRADGSENWHLIESYYEGKNWEMIVLQETIANSTSFMYDAVNEKIVLETHPGVSYSVTLSGAVVLSGISDDYGKIVISTADLSEEIYVLTLSQGDDVKTLEFAVKPLNPEE